MKETQDVFQISIIYMRILFHQSIRSLPPNTIDFSFPISAIQFSIQLNTQILNHSQFHDQKASEWEKPFIYIYISYKRTFKSKNVDVFRYFVFLSLCFFFLSCKYCLCNKIKKKTCSQKKKLITSTKYNCTNKIKCCHNN